MSKEKLNELEEILLKEYKIKFSGSELLSSAIGISEFAKTIIKFKLKNKDE